jgi:hypothetical protein
MKKRWPFTDPKNVATITLRDVVERRCPILLVTREEEDGCWQFLDGRDSPDPADPLVVGLEEVYKLDRSISELADLPLGWQAWREAPGEPWQREEMEREEGGEEALD